jgi:hypothetical protein
MKHFTPERLIRLQDRANRARFLRSLEDWETAAKSYKRQLAKLRDRLPVDLGLLIDSVPLHDAQVLDMWWGGRSQFTITLLAGAAPSHLVVLTYSLVEKPEVAPEVLPESVRSAPTLWLYDELDSGGVTRRAPTFMHNILLSDGREIRLHFRSVTVRRPVSLVPAINSTSAQNVETRHSA